MSSPTTAVEAPDTSSSVADDLSSKRGRDETVSSSNNGLDVSKDDNAETQILREGEKRTKLSVQRVADTTLLAGAPITDVLTTSVETSKPNTGGFGASTASSGFGRKADSGVGGGFGSSGTFRSQSTKMTGFGSASASGGYFMKAAASLGKGSGFGGVTSVNSGSGAVKDTKSPAHIEIGSRAMADVKESTKVESDSKDETATGAEKEMVLTATEVDEKEVASDSAPTVPLAGLVDENFEYTTGEEGEKHVYKCRARLHQLNSAQGVWNSLGEGQLSLNEARDDVNGSRLVLRSLGSMKLLLNVKLFDGMTIEPVNMKQIRFVAVEFEDIDGKPKQIMKTYLLVVSRQDQEALLHAISSRVVIAKKKTNLPAESETTDDLTAAAGDFQKDKSNLQEIARSAVQNK